jgi:hypothetical protein
MENLRAEFPPLLESVGQSVSSEMMSFIAGEAPRNISRHDSYMHYYSDQLQRLVQERDGEVIERHHYRFGA